jgi:hypothetical protein
MGEDPGDHDGLGDHGDDPHQPLAPGTGERIDLEDAAEQLRPAVAVPAVAVPAVGPSALSER